MPVSFVRELAGDLIDIHGQHEHQSLLYEKNHLGILDNFARAELGDRLVKCRRLHRKYMQAKRQWADASSDAGSRAKELDFLQFEVQEIEAAHLIPGEDEELEASYRMMANGQKIMEALSEAGSLTGASGYSGAGDEIGRAVRCLGVVQAYDPSLGELSGSLEEIETLLDDFNRSLAGIYRWFQL